MSRLAVRVAFVVLTTALVISGRAAAAEPAGPSAAAAPDVVLLKDGGMLRGTIAELSPNKRVVIVLVTGEKRTESMKNVAYAGPAANAPQQGAVAAPTASPSATPSPEPAPPSGVAKFPGASPPSAPNEPAKSKKKADKRPVSGIEQALLDGDVRTIETGPNEGQPAAGAPAAEAAGAVHFESDVPGLTVYVMTGTGGVTVFGMGGVAHFQMEPYRPLCAMPCTASLPPGAYRFGISESTADTPTRVQRLISVGNGDTVHLGFESRSGGRAVGWVVFLGGGGLGTALALGSRGCNESGCSDERPGVFIGIAIALVSVIVGPILAFQSDVGAASVTAGPVALTPPSWRRESFARTAPFATPPGFGVTGTF